MSTDASEPELGGHLASWDEAGHPIEHGFHCLFGFYDAVLPLLERVGAMGNFERSPRHTCVYERGQVHVFDPQTWVRTYHGFTDAEKLSLLAAVPMAADLLSGVALRGFDALDEHDDIDLRDFARRRGIEESLVTSGYLQQIYDIGFNSPGPLSAAVGLKTLYKFVERPWAYHFKRPARRAG